MVILYLGGSPRFLTLHRLSCVRVTSSIPAEMGPQSLTTLVLCGKSSAENLAAWNLKTNASLKLPDGSKVNAALHSEIEIGDYVGKNDDVFRIDSYMNRLATSRFGRLLVYSPELASTHDVISHNFSVLPVGAVCVADVQLKGRGRSKNTWESPKGCLMFSFSIQMEDGRVIPFLQYVVSLAMVEAIGDICLQKGMPRLDVRIKWPNDLYLDGLKFGGVLCTSAYKAKKFNVSAGKYVSIANSVNDKQVVPMNLRNN